MRNHLRSNPLLAMLDKLHDRSAKTMDATDFHFECASRFMEAASHMDFSKTREQIEREVRAEFLAAGKAVPK